MGWFYRMLGLELDTIDMAVTPVNEGTAKIILYNQRTGEISGPKKIAVFDEYFERELRESYLK